LNQYWKRAATDRAETQKEQLIEALEKTAGNQSRAAELLGVSRVTAWNRMKRFGITANRKVNC
jgi:transcriptional regulator of acetoin/glycerol metabolism